MYHDLALVVCVFVCVGRISGSEVADPVAG